ncbi:MAG: molybdopterin-dependent oxidoreductase [Rhodobacteraceae bacterium]|nr:molybdopterin-dependent oxidoreductase [Paracoccaceae bacterium]
MYSIARLFFLFLALALPAQAAEILTVRGPALEKNYDMEALLEFEQVTIQTKNDYVELPTEFSGPLLRDVLEAHGIGSGETVVLRALNDYATEMPARLAYEYDVILAVLRGGRAMPIRDKGPIWVIFPMEDLRQTPDTTYNNYLVWQLAEIERK